MRELTSEQEQAVARRSGPLLLAAGAGSGKTSVLVERFVRAVREDGVSPASILAITFTDRAAGELRERVRARLAELGDRSGARETEAAFISTFHGFCARLLRAHPLISGLDPQFVILDDALAARIRARAFRAALGGFIEGERRAAVDLLAAYGADRLATMVQGVHSELRSRGRRDPRLPEPPAGTEDAQAAGACGLLDELLRSYGDSYESLKTARGAVDFDDLELLARELLDRDAGVRAAWSERFEMLMVDEFQDTNPRQLAILRALERENLFTVGDELQAIYGFRHADVRIFRARSDELAGAPGNGRPAGSGGSLSLVRNFRSRPALLAAINAVFGERIGTAYRPLVAAAPSRPADGPATEQQGRPHEEEPLIELLLADRRGTAAEWRVAEAEALAGRVGELVRSRRTRAGDVAVLLRALGDVEVYERALNEQGLRTLAAAGGFWGRQQVGDLLAYLGALANPLDEPALYSTLASPLVGCSSDGLALIARAAGAQGAGQVWETIRCAPEDLTARLAHADRLALERFRANFLTERAAAPRHTISALLERAIEWSGYSEHVLGLEWGERRLANVHKLLDLARRFEAREGRDLRGFLDHAAAQQSSTGPTEADAPVPDGEADAVRLMSIHAAKGLEFPVVCVADLGRTQNLSVPDLLVDGERIGLRLVRLDGARGTPALDYPELCLERRQAQAEEEDRILYVAMTRARERLLLSGGVDFERWPERGRSATTISWLGPALFAELPALVKECARPVQDVEVRPGGPMMRLWLSTSGPSARAERTAPTARAEPSAPGESGPVAPVAARAQIDAPSASQLSMFGELETPQPAERPQEIESLRPQEIESLSYTTLNELERCGYRYYLERVLGLPENTAAVRSGASGEGLEARARGTLVHRLLESVDFALAGGPSPGDVARVARELGLRVGRAEREEIAALVGGVAGSALAERVAAAQQVRREHPFAFSLGPDEPLITGVIDLLAREADGGWLVLDYKSDRVQAEEDLNALVERGYGVQRLLYALAVLRAGAQSVEIVHWFLERPADWVLARYGAQERGELEDQLRGRIWEARAKGFMVTQQPHRGLCATCPGRTGLCSYGDAETLRELPGHELAGGRGAPAGPGAS